MSQMTPVGEPAKGKSQSVLLRAVVIILRVLSAVVLVIGAIAVRFTARQQPLAAFAVLALTLMLVALLWGAVALIRWVVCDAYQPRPGPGVAAFKLAVGAILLGFFLIGVAVPGSLLVLD